MSVQIFFLSVLILVASVTTAFMPGLDPYIPVTTKYGSSGLVFPKDDRRFNAYEDTYSTDALEEDVDKEFEEKFKNMDKDMMNKVNTMEDFFKMFDAEVIENDIFENIAVNDSTITVSARSGFNINAEEDKIEHAVCTPEPTLVTLNVSKSRGSIYYPTCVRIMRCGGCCVADGTSCQATESRQVKIEVGEVMLQRSRRQTGSGGRARRVPKATKHYFFEEEHLSCGCYCDTTSGHCDPYIHDYDSSSCNCICRNTEERAKCNQEHLYNWSEEMCKCLCKEHLVKECSTGYEYDHIECKCMKKGSNLIFENDIEYGHERSLRGYGRNPFEHGIANIYKKISTYPPPRRMEELTWDY